MQRDYPGPRWSVNEQDSLQVMASPALPPPAIRTAGPFSFIMMNRTHNIFEEQ